MKSRHAFSALTLAVLAIAATSASAQTSLQYQEPGFFYGGVSAGETRAKVDEAAVAAGVKRLVFASICGRSCQYSIACPRP